MVKAMKRNENLDVFRCLAMFAIVLCHVYQHDKEIVPQSTTRDFLFLNLIRWNVDAFLALSGWFGMKFTLKKFGKIWGLMAFYSVVSILVGRLIMGVTTPIKIDGGWFGNAYLCLLLIVPFLNTGIEGLVGKGVMTAWLAWSGFAAMVFVNWLSRNSYFGILAFDVQSHTLVNMVFVYFTVRLFRLTNMVGRVKRWHLAVAGGAFVVGCVIFGNARTDYIAPYTIAMALALLVFFERFIILPQWLCRVCVWIAPSMFGVYLLHEPSCFGRFFHRVPLQFLVEHGFSPELAIVIAAVACFAICLALDLMRRYSLRGIIAICKRKSA